MKQLTHIIPEFEQTLNEFADTLSLFTQEQVNQVPFKDSWTGGQVARHIEKALQGMPELLQHGKVKETEGAPDEKTEMIDADFLNFNIKMKSPDFIKPEEKSYNKEELVASLKGIAKKTAEAAKNKDLSLTCLEFELPVYGHLTLYELLHFGKVHTQRHMRQLNNIYQKIRGKVASV